MEHSLSDINAVCPRVAQRDLPTPLVFILFLLTWTAANWPAFTQFWWHADDFARATRFDPWFSINQGRPLEMVVPYLMHLDYNAESLWLHQGIRLLQAVLHVLTAVLLVKTFQRQTNPGIAFSAVLFFLFWPFHGEAVLWPSAMAYPLAATLSLWGIHAISNGRQPRSWLGIILIMSAVLVNQLAAFAALSVWVIGQTFFVFQHNRFAPGWVREGLNMLGGYLSGGLLSLGLIYLRLGEPGRAALPSNFVTKLHFWLELNRQYLASPNYPQVLRVLQILLVVATLSAVVIAWWRQAVTLRQAGAAVGLLALLSILPYLPVFLTVESSPAWRILYLAPLISVAAWLILQQLLWRYRRSRMLSWVVIVLFLWIYIPMNIRNAADYVNVFNADLKILRAIEKAAVAQQPPLGQVIVATYPDYLRTWDLYHVTYMHYDSKKSAFLRDWSAIPLLTYLSTLTAVPATDNLLAQDPVLLQQCVTLCWADGQQQPWQQLSMPDAQTLCVCP